MKNKSQTIHNGLPVEETITETAPHSIELSCNAKGQYSWSIKMYYRDGESESTVGEIEKINNILLQRFPNVDDTKKLTELDQKAQSKKS